MRLWLRKLIGRAKCYWFDKHEAFCVTTYMLDKDGRVTTGHEVRCMFCYDLLDKETDDGSKERCSEA